MVAISYRNPSFALGLLSLLSVAACGSDKPSQSANPGTSGSSAGGNPSTAGSGTTTSGAGGITNPTGGAGGTNGSSGAAGALPGGGSAGALPGGGGGAGGSGGMAGAGMDNRPSVPDSATGSAFDAIKGALNVKYAEYMSK